MQRFHSVLTRRALVTWLLASSALAQGQAMPSLGTGEVFAPARPGPVVLVLSGASGPAPYRSYAGQVAALGYHTVLLDGRDVLTREKNGQAHLLAAIEAARAAPTAKGEQVAVIGFSQGGGGALLHAAPLKGQVALVVAHYPAISWAPDLNWLAGRLNVPVLVLAGEQDRYNGCCLIEGMRSLAQAAQLAQRPLELVSYPQADHGFNLATGAYRSDDSADAWRRTMAMLASHLPLPAP